MADDKATGEGEDMSFASKEVYGTLGAAWKKEAGMCATGVKGEDSSVVGPIGSSGASAEHVCVGSR